MKMNKFLLGMLGALTLSLASCSSDEPRMEPGDNGSDSRFMSVAIRNVDLGSRAGGDQAGDRYEEGLDAENAVNSIRFYFFDGEGKAFPVTPAGNNFYDCQEITTEEGNGMPYVEKYYRAVIILNTQEANYSNLKSMVAVVNGDLSALGTANKTLAELQATVADYGKSTEGKMFNNKSTDIPAHIMTSSVYGTSDANAGCEVAIKQAQLATSEADANANPVDVYVERVLAKVRVTAKFDNSKFNFTVPEGTNTIRIQLRDQDGKDYEATDGTKIYAELLGWGIQTYTDRSYLFKSVEGWNGWDIGNWWNDADHIRSYWAINPAGVEHKNIQHSKATAKIGTVLTTVNGDVTTTINYNGDFMYTQENAGDRTTDGHKTNYNPAAATSNRTQVYVRARLVDQNGNAVPLIEWGGQRYTIDGGIQAMLAVVNSNIMTRTGAEGSYTYNSITPDMVRLVNAEDIDKANTDTELSKRYLSYIQLTEAAENTTFYANDDAHSVLTTDAVNEILAGVPGAKVWQGGDTYYYADLTHLNPSTATADNTEKGAYGVVRNHIYEVELNSIFGLGTPVLTPNTDEEKPIIPQKPTTDAYYLGARLNILSWRVVANNVKFEW